MITIKLFTAQGYSDIGEYWREEFEIPDLESVFDEMYRQVEPLYRLLHAVVRFRLARLYPDVVDTSQPIPAHLLGIISLRLKTVNLFLFFTADH